MIVIFRIRSVFCIFLGFLFCMIPLQGMEKKKNKNNDKVNVGALLFGFSTGLVIGGVAALFYVKNKLQKAKQHYDNESLVTAVCSNNKSNVEYFLKNGASTHYMPRCTFYEIDESCCKVTIETQESEEHRIHIENQTGQKQQLEKYKRENLSLLQANLCWNYLKKDEGTEIMVLLIQHGANLYHQDSHGETVLHYAARRGKECYNNIFDELAKTSIMPSSQQIQTLKLLLLIKKYSDSSLKNVPKSIVLKIAGVSLSDKKLISSRVDVSIKNNNGLTCEQILKRNAPIVTMY